MVFFVFHFYFSLVLTAYKNMVPHCRRKRLKMFLITDVSVIVMDLHDAESMQHSGLFALQQSNMFYEPFAFHENPENG